MTDISEAYDAIPQRYPEFEGKVAIVTGSSRGIGRGIAMRLAREGMKVVINSRTVLKVEATTAELIAVGAEAIAVPGDVGKVEDVDRLFTETVTAFGTVDLLVNNAAILTRKHFFEVEDELVDRELAANVRGPHLCAKRAATIMRNDEHGGSIINISSVGGLQAHWRGLPYDVTKGALDAMTRAMALELADYDIRVNGIAPGATRTERWPSPDNPRMQAVAERIPLRGFGHPLDIGAAVAFLASTDARYITGQTIYVDGGIIAQLSPRGQPI
jgi:3-oxoacyl-[acyl-carrier protein] reductase